MLSCKQISDVTKSVWAEKKDKTSIRLLLDENFFYNALLLVKDTKIYPQLTSITLEVPRTAYYNGVKHRPWRFANDFDTIEDIYAGINSATHFTRALAALTYLLKLGSIRIEHSVKESLSGRRVSYNGHRKV